MKEAMVERLVEAVKGIAGEGYEVSIILYNEQLAQLSEKLNDDLLIMPSSIHEVLAVPASSMNAIDLKQMVGEVNDTEVSEQEILGYSVYRYNRKTGVVEVAA